MDRLTKWGVHVTNALCPFCHQCDESHHYLFFDCTFSKELWLRIMAFCDLKNAPSDWPSVLAWSSHHFKGKSLISLICRLSFNADICHLWCERNRRIFARQNLPLPQILMKVVRDIQQRLLSLTNISKDVVNVELCHNFGLGNTLFK